MQITEIPHPKSLNIKERLGGGLAFANEDLGKDY